MATTSATTAQGQATIDVSSRTAIHATMRAADAAFANGDHAFAERACRSVLATDCENREALALLVCILTRANRHMEAIAYVDGVLSHFRSLQESNTIVHALLALQQRGFEAHGVIDVGAYEGELAMFARQMFAGASVVMIEPQAQKQEFLQALAAELGGDCHVRQCLLGERVRDSVEFHQTKTPFGSTGSSIYPERSEFPRDVVPMPMRTLDDLMHEFRGRTFDLMKIDVQGAELDVLRGGEETLRSVQVLVAELSLHELNRGAPRLAEVTAALDEAGFAMFDVLTLPRTRRLMVQIDAVFVRKDSPLWSAD